MLKIFLSSTYRDLAEYRSKILDKLNSAFNGVGMEQFVPDGSNSQEVCVGYLKETDVVIFLISQYYGSLMNTCSLIEECKAECPMKTESGKISYTHCEYKTTLAEGILHQTYIVGKGWDAPDVKKEVSEFREEIGKEYLGFVDIEDPDLVQHICNNLAAKLVEWHKQDRLDFNKFIDREEELNEIIDSIDSKVEVWGVGGIGKTTLIEVALLVEKLKGRKILTIGTSKTYTSGSGFEYFRNKRGEDHHITEFRDKITIYDVINAFAENGLLPNAEEINNLPMNKKIEILSQKIRSEKNLTLFIDDFHLASEDVVNMAKSVDHLILSSRMNTYIARKEIYLSGIDEKSRLDLIKLFSTEIPENVKELINKLAEGHPVSTELLVRNYDNINFDKIKDFKLIDADDKQVQDFYERVIEEIFSTNKPALNLLKDLAILNIDLPNNIERESVLKAYNIGNARMVFKALVDTGMLRKREGKEGMYEFYFKHIQDVLENDVNQESHVKAIEYYNKKREIFGDNIDDAVEVLYHKVKSNSSEINANEFIKLYKKVRPIHYGFKRLIDVGEELIISLGDKYKVLILKYLGNLYLTLKRIEEAEDRYLESLNDIKPLKEKDLNFYLFEKANIKYNLGQLYYQLKRLSDSKLVYNEALQSYKELSKIKPEIYKVNVADTHHALGTVYWKLKKFNN